MERERRQGRPLGRGWRFYIPALKNALQGLVGALEGRGIKYYPFTLDRVTRNTLCSGAAAPSGGGSCLLLGERRKLGGVQGALSRAALVAPAGARSHRCRCVQPGGLERPWGTTILPGPFRVPMSPQSPQSLVP